ncbi:MAG TPA: hypothetical protein VG389_07345 [Myxococcota bacterium]|jgi:hypothetical protein|nr:hypothetical protein [Myxococcota bacterium]
MSREFTYYVREFRAREDVQRFIEQEINDPGCADEVVSVVLEHGRGWVLIGRSPRARVAAGGGRSYEEMPAKGGRDPAPAMPDAGWGRGGVYPDGRRSYGPGARSHGPGSGLGSGAGGGGSGGGAGSAAPPDRPAERAIDTRGRRGTGRMKLPDG